MPSSCHYDVSIFTSTLLVAPLKEMHRQRKIRRIYQIGECLLEKQILCTKKYLNVYYKVETSDVVYRISFDGSLPLFGAMKAC